MPTAPYGDLMRDDNEKPATSSATGPEARPAQPPKAGPERHPAKPAEFGGPTGPEPTRYGDWERNGRVSDF
jgi:hypothetical protein